MLDKRKVGVLQLLDYQLNTKKVGSMTATVHIRTLLLKKRLQVDKVINDKAKIGRPSQCHKIYMMKIKILKFNFKLCTLIPLSLEPE